MSAAVSAQDREDNVRMIRESAAGLVDPDRLVKLRGLRKTTPGVDPEDWNQAVELGWLALLTPEAQGGVGMGLTEYCALCEEVGRGLLPETVLVAAAVAPLLPDAARDAALGGERVILPAWQSALGDPLSLGATTASGGAVSGVKRFVPFAASASDFLVRTQDGLRLVAADADGVSLKTVYRQDGGHWGELSLNNAASEAVPGDEDAAREAITLGVSAYLLGVMDRAFEVAMDYLKTRRQFDKPIGAFQALQHKSVDMQMQLELTRASVAQTARLTDDPTTDDKARRLAVSRTKARASDASMFVTRMAVQLHGGIGYTDECDIGLYLRKAMVLSNFFGSSSYHRKRYAALSGFAERGAGQAQ